MNPFEKQIKDYEEYLRILKLAEKTIKGYLIYVKIFSKWIMGKGVYDLKEITYEFLKEYQLILTNQIGKKYSINTVYKKVLIIKQFFAYLEKTRILFYNPAEKMILPLLGDKLPKIVPTEQEVKKLLLAPNTGTLTGTRDRTILELLYTSGIRCEECENLNVYDVDYKGGYLRISKGKGGKDRILPLGKTACDWLREYILKVRPQLLKNNPDERRLFVSRYKKSLSGQSINLVVKRNSLRAKIRRLTTHAMRRAFATHMLRNEANPMYIQRLLGHSTAEVLDRYIKVACIDLKKTHKKTHPRERDKK